MGKVPVRQSHTDVRMGVTNWTWWRGKEGRERGKDGGSEGGKKGYESGRAVSLGYRGIGGGNEE